MIPEPEQPLPPADASEALQRALRDAEERLAYFERIGPFLEQQMAVAAERATKIVHETEQQEADLARELRRLRDELDTLQGERDRRQEEASVIVAQAQAEAAHLLSQARHAISAVLASTLAQLDRVQDGLLVDVPPSRPAREDKGALLRDAEEATAQPAREEEPTAVTTSTGPAQPASGEPASGEPASGEPANGAGPPIVGLIVHTQVTRNSLLRFQLALQAQAGIIGTTVQRLDADSFELAVAHRPDVAVLNALRKVPDLSFAVVAEAEDKLEIELHQPDPTTSP